MLGARIAALRRDKGLSQTELARRLGVSPSAVGRYEQGRREPAAALIVALAREFEVSTDYLLTGVPGPGESRAVNELLQRRLACGSRRPGELSPQELLCLLSAALNRG